MSLSLVGGRDSISSHRGKVVSVTEKSLSALCSYAFGGKCFVMSFFGRCLSTVTPVMAQCMIALLKVGDLHPLIIWLSALGVQHGDFLKTRVHTDDTRPQVSVHHLSMWKELSVETEATVQPAVFFPSMLVLGMTFPHCTLDLSSLQQGTMFRHVDTPDSWLWHLQATTVQIILICVP